MEKKTGCVFQTNGIHILRMTNETNETNEEPFSLTFEDPDEPMMKTMRLCNSARNRGHSRATWMTVTAGTVRSLEREWMSLRRLGFLRLLIRLSEPGSNTI